MKRKTMKIGMVAFAILLATTLVSAGLISYYGTVKTTANVQQSVVIDGQDWNTAIDHDFNIVGGCTEIFKHKITNRGCVEAPVDITTSMNTHGKGSNGVNVNYYIMDGSKTLRLENKDPVLWTPITDDTFYADFTYNPCCPNLVWTLDGVFASNTEYVLIYYADQPDRFVDWGGAPAFEIARFTSDVGTGAFSVSGNQNLGRCLPYADDWNIGPDAHYNWASVDGYVHGKGAKIWLIPTSDYGDTNKVLTDWNPTTYLFETDLIAYFDCDINPIPAYLFPYFGYETPISPETYTLQPGEEICLFIEYAFDIAIMPGQYDVTTQVIPQ